MLGIAGFLTLSIARYAKEHYRTQSFGYWVCYLPQVTEWETFTLLSPLERPNANHSMKS
jgi:hypothetical protein